MAKELPYFRFTAFEWLNDDISLESYEFKGLFIDICAYYWFKDCSITKAMLKKRFSNDIDMLFKLINLDIIKHDDNTDYIKINFLDEQFDILSDKRKKRQEAGRAGGLKRASNAKAMLKQKSSYKDKDKDKDKEKEIKKYKDNIHNIFENIKDYFTNKQNKENSLDVIDKLIRIDKYTENQITDTIHNKHNTFYGKNVQSIQSLRNKKDGVSKFDKLFNYLNDNNDTEININTAIYKKECENLNDKDNENVKFYFKLLREIKNMPDLLKKGAITYNQSVRIKNYAKTKSVKIFDNLDLIAGSECVRYNKALNIGFMTWIKENSKAL